MFSSTIPNLGWVSGRADQPFQIVAAIDNIIGTRTSTYTETIEGHERGVVQRSRCLNQRIWTKDV